MKLFLLLLVAVSATMADHDPQRDSRFFSLFNIVRFNNGPCNGTDDEMGICYTRRECDRENGEAAGTCAQGFGVCCIIKHECDSESNQQVVYFQNPGYSNSYSEIGRCKFTLNKCNTNICQVRLDFLDFEITRDDASPSGSCDQDTFVVTGGMFGSFGPLCGYNTGQHVYLHTDGTTPCMMNMMIDNEDSDRKWNIKATQIDCTKDCEDLAPRGCTQYFTGVNGKISSFNFDEDNPGRNVHLEDQQQVICIRPESGFCGIEYTQNEDLTAAESFAISADNVGIACVDDFVLIPNGHLEGADTIQDRYCGDAWPDNGGVVEVISTDIKPYQFVFISTQPGAEVAAEAVGFSLEFTQKACR